MKENTDFDIVVVGGGTSPLWKTAGYYYTGSASIDKWRVKKSGN